MIRFDLPDDETQLLKDTAERFVQDHYELGQRAKMLTAPIDQRPAHWADMADLGWLVAPLPEQANGLGLTAAQVVPFLEVLGAGMVLEPVVAVAMNCAPTMARALDTDKAAKRLEPVVTGESLEVIAAGMPDAPVMATTNGGDLTLNGCAPLVMGGAFANAFWVVARQGEDTLLARVERDRVRVEPFGLVDGQAAARVTFDDVVCTSEDVTTGCADAVAYGADMAIVGHLAEMSGLMDALYGDTLDYVKLREQFGRPIGRFQAVQHRMADIFIRREEARSMVRLAAEAMEAEDDGFRRRLVSAARVKIVENARAVLRDAVQLHGGMGVTDELPVGHRVKRLLVLTQIGGSRSDHLKRFRAAA